MLRCVPQRRSEVDPLWEKLGEAWRACWWFGERLRSHCGEYSCRRHTYFTDLLPITVTSTPPQTFPPKLVLVDFGDMDSMPEVIEEILDCYGCLDVLILNSSMKVKAPAQSLSLEMDKLLMDNNYFGPVTLAKGRRWKPPPVAQK